MTHEPRKQRAVGYLRQSKRKLDSISFDIQQSAIEEHCRRNGLELVAVHGDEGISGLKGIDQRPGMQAALGDLKTGKAEVLVVWKFSRVSRNRLHQAMILQELKDIGARIQAATEPIDTSSAAGQFGMDVLLSLAQMEASQRGEVWKESHDSRLRRGLHPQHRKFFGYDKDPLVGYTPNAEADLIREAYRKYISGAGFTSLAQWLNAQGTKPLIGSTWNQVSVRRLMDNPIYVGRINFRGEEHPGSHEALISEEVWQAYRKSRTERATVPPRTKSSPHWMSGVIKCGICGQAMGRQKGGSGIVYRMCNSIRRGSGNCPGNSIRESEVDAYVALWLYARMDELTKLLPSEDEALEAARQAVASAEAKLDGFKGERARLMRLAASMDWSPEETKEAMAGLAGDLQDSQKEVDLARASLGSFVTPQDNLELLGRAIELLGEDQQGDEQWIDAMRRAVGKIIIAPRTEGVSEWDRITVSK